MTRTVTCTPQEPSHTRSSLSTVCFTGAKKPSPKRNSCGKSLSRCVVPWASPSSLSSRPSSTLLRHSIALLLEPCSTVFVCRPLPLNVVRYHDPSADPSLRTFIRCISSSIRRVFTRWLAVPRMAGGHGVATPTARDAVVEGIHNLMRHMGMQEGEIVPQTVVPAHLRLDNLHRSMSYPCATFLKSALCFCMVVKHALWL